MSEITLKFRKVPFNVFRGSDMDLPMRDHLTVRVQPNEGITIGFNVKQPGPGMHLGRAAMDFDYDEAFAHTEIADAYELLLLEAMRGDHSLFIRQDGVERAWEILQPVLEHPTPVCFYERGSWGPPEADELIRPREVARDGRPRRARLHEPRLSDRRRSAEGDLGAGDDAGSARPSRGLPRPAPVGRRSRDAQPAPPRLELGRVPSAAAGPGTRGARRGDRVVRGRPRRPGHGAVPRARGVLDVGGPRGLRRGPRRLRRAGQAPARRRDGADGDARGGGPGPRHGPGRPVGRRSTRRPRPRGRSTSGSGTCTRTGRSSRARICSATTARSPSVR